MSVDHHIYGYGLPSICCILHCVVPSSKQASQDSMTLGSGQGFFFYSLFLKRTTSGVACLFCLFCNASSALQVAQLRCSFRQKAGSTCTVATSKFPPGPKAARHLLPFTSHHGLSLLNTTVLFHMSSVLLSCRVRSVRLHYTSSAS